MLKRPFSLTVVLLGGLCFWMSGVVFADAPALLEQAKTYTGSGYRQQAEQIYKSIAADYPGTDYALKAQSELIILGIVEKTDSEIQDAIDSLAASYSNNPALPDTLCDVAMGFGWAGTLQHAKNLYQQVIQQWPESSAVRKAQLGVSRIDIVLLIKAGDYSAAETQIAQILEDFSDLSSMPGALYHIARRYQWSREYERAESIHQELIRRYPDSDMADRARLDMARAGIPALVKGGDFDTAGTELDKLLQDFSGNSGLPLVLYGIAKEYEVRVKYEKAGEIYQKIIQQYPDSPYAGQARFDFPRTKILSLVESGNDTAADTEFDKFVQEFSAHPKLPNAIYDIARKYEWLREYEKAKTLYTQITGSYPDSSAASDAQLGISRINTLLPIEAGDYDTAGAELEKLAEGFQNDQGLPETLWHIAKAYQREMEYQRCQAVLQQIIQQYPESSYAAKARTGLAVVNVLLLNKMGDYAVADAAVDSLIADFNDPSELTAAIYQIEEGYYNKAFTYGKPTRQDHLSAVTAWEKLMAKLPDFSYDNPDINYFIACSYYQLARYETAIGYYKKVALNWPDSGSYAWGNLDLMEKCYQGLVQTGLIAQTLAETLIEQSFDAIIENSPKSISAKYACQKLGRKNFDTSQWADAALYFELLWLNFPDEPGTADIVYDLGKVYEQMGKISLAVAVYEQFLEAHNSVRIQQELDRLRAML